MLRYLLNRSNESSSLVGVVLSLGGMMGWSISESQAESIISAFLAIAGLIAAFFPDRFSGKSRQTDVADDDDDEMDAAYDPRDAFGRVMPTAPAPRRSDSGSSLTTPQGSDHYSGPVSPRRLESDYSLDDTSSD